MTEKHIAAEWIIPLQGVQKLEVGSMLTPPAAQTDELRAHLAQQRAAERLRGGIINSTPEDVLEAV